MSQTYLAYVGYQRTFFTQNLTIDERSVVNSPAVINENSTVTVVPAGTLVSRELPTADIGTPIRLFVA